MGELHALFDDFKGRADFYVVYIMEAHASDEWPINSARCNGPGNTIRQTHTTAGRLAVASQFVARFHVRMPVLVDPAPDNPFDAAFAPWPIRFYVLEEGRVQYIAQPEGASFSVQDLREFLETRGVESAARV